MVLDRRGPILKLKLALATGVRELRERIGLTQAALAQRFKGDEVRVTGSMTPIRDRSLTARRNKR